MKKRKLNSTNPKYYPVKEDEVKERKELIDKIDQRLYEIQKNR